MLADHSALFDPDRSVQRPDIHRRAVSPTSHFSVTLIASSSRSRVSKP
jgi:hypothetical protein